MAAEMRSRMVRQPSRESTDGSMNSYSSEGKWVEASEHQTHDMCQTGRLIYGNVGRLGCP